MIMLRSTDLMVGDWVNYQYNDEHIKPSKVTGLWENGMIELTFTNGMCVVTNIIYVMPIPITPEILEKNEFIKENTWSGIFTMKYCFYEEGGIKYEELNFDKKIAIEVEFSASDNHIRHINIDCFTDKGCAKINLCNKEGMFYVHELQRALKLCGIEKEIIL